MDGLMAGVVRGIREVVHELVELEDQRGLRQGPVQKVQRRRCTDLTPEAIARTVGRHAHDLPVARGAGPCGTLARRPTGRGYAGWWSRHHLLAPLRNYYATYEPPLRFGAKPGPRGRKA